MKLRWKLVSLAYAGLSVLGAGLSQIVHHQAFHHPTPTFFLPSWQKEVVSCAIGLSFAVLMVVFTRIVVFRTVWAAELHRSLRPIVEGLDFRTILVVSLLSGFGEELLFRAFLGPLVGVIPQALVFGLAHQVPGPSRWAWILWATFVGLALGLLYQSFGTISGPILAHATINAINLVHLRDNNPASRLSL